MPRRIHGRPTGRLAPAALLAGALLLLLSAAGAMPAAAQHATSLYAAGSLKAAMSEIAEAFTEATGLPVETTFGPSGLLRERIEAGEPAELFASANMKHPQTLAAAGRGGPVVLFARNRLCAMTRQGLSVTSEGLLDALLDPAVRVGTSTPKADPSGDYAWKLFEKAEALRPGSFETLDAKALKLTGGPDSAAAPAGRNPYAWVMTEDRADLFLTYCTNVVLARQDTPELQLVAVPATLSVGADYGLNLLAAHRPEAARLALFILSPDGQAILDRYGFEAPALP